MTLKLALTPGEPAGIGPDIVIQLAQHRQQYQLVSFADPEMMIARAKILGLPLKLLEANEKSHLPVPGELINIPVRVKQKVKAGVLNSANANYVLECLDMAVHACESGYCQAMVTGPVQKSVIAESGIPFTGHTEYLADKTNTETVVMMLATEQLRVALVTTHIPLKDVSDAIDRKLLRRVIETLHQDLQLKFGLTNPRILVSGLNPHAGEDGHLGREEIEVIQPVLSTLRKLDMNLLGPLPADTLFTSKYLDNADAVLVMFHDQGLPVLKSKGFGKAANISLGLPIIRTSVDHGTALSIAGTGSADFGSLRTAVNVALQMAKKK